MFCCLRNFVLLQFIACFKLLVSQKNNVCVCVCVCVCVGACVHIVTVKYFPCIWAVFSSVFHWVVDVLLYWMFLCKWRARKQISLHRDNKVVLYCTYNSTLTSAFHGEREDCVCDRLFHDYALKAATCHLQRIYVHFWRLLCKIIMAAGLHTTIQHTATF